MSETLDIDLARDQAAGLRALFGARAPQIVAFAAAGASCGRTTLLVQTATALARSGQSVVIVDENEAPDNAVAAFGLTARHDLMHVIRRQRTLPQVALAASLLLHIVPAARAARELDPADPAAMRQFVACLQELQRGAGFVLIDCAPSRGGQLSPLAQAARHLAVVVAAQGPAITHAYAMIKQLALESGRDAFQLIVTRARSSEEARAIFFNMKRVAKEHLGVRLDLLATPTTPITDHLADALACKLPASREHTASGGFAYFPAPANSPGIVMV